MRELSTTPALGQGVEERGFASVGVADQRDHGDRDGFTALALLRTDAAHVLDLLLDVLDAAMNFAAVGFELGFARSAGADAAAKLRHLSAAAGEAWKHVLKLRQFDLELAFAGAGVAGKDVENQLRAIDDAAVKFALEITKLGRRQLVVEDENSGIGHLGGGGNLFDLAAADQGCRVGTVAALQHLSHHHCAGALGQLAQLGKRLFGIEGHGVIFGFQTHGFGG